MKIIQNRLSIDNNFEFLQLEDAINFIGYKAKPKYSEKPLSDGYICSYSIYSKKEDVLEHLGFLEVNINGCSLKFNTEGI